MSTQTISRNLISSPLLAALAYFSIMFIGGCYAKAEEKTKTRPMMQQLRQNEQAENANVNGSFDENQARAFANKQAQLMTDLIVEKERTRSQVYDVLTPEQRQKALQLMQERQQHRQERMSMKKQAEQKQQSK